MAAPRPLGGSRYHGGPCALPSLFLPKAASPSRNGEDSRTSRAGELLKNLLCFCGSFHNFRVWLDEGEKMEVCLISLFITF